MAGSDWQTITSQSESKTIRVLPSMNLRFLSEASLFSFLSFFLFFFFFFFVGGGGGEGVEGGGVRLFAPSLSVSVLETWLFATSRERVVSMLVCAIFGCDSREWQP